MSEEIWGIKPRLTEEEEKFIEEESKIKKAKTELINKWLDTAMSSLDRKSLFNLAIEESGGDEELLNLCRYKMIEAALKDERLMTNLPLRLELLYETLCAIDAMQYSAYHSDFLPRLSELLEVDSDFVKWALYLLKAVNFIGETICDRNEEDEEDQQWFYITTRGKEILELNLDLAKKEDLTSAIARSRYALKCLRERREERREEMICLDGAVTREEFNLNKLKEELRKLENE